MNNEELQDLLLKKGYDVPLGWLYALPTKATGRGQMEGHSRRAVVKFANYWPPPHNKVGRPLGVPMCLLRFRITKRMTERKLPAPVRQERVIWSLREATEADLPRFSSTFHK